MLPVLVVATVVVILLAVWFVRRQGAAERDGIALDRLGRVFENQPVPVFVIDAQHRVTHWNRACELVTGTAARDVVGTTDPWKAFYPSQRPVMADVVLDGYRDGQLDRYYAGKYHPSRFIPECHEAEDFFPHMGSEGVWLSFTAAPLFDDHGRPVGAIETLVDITERKRAEQALLAERNFLNSLLEAIPVPVFYKDTGGRYLGCNEAFVASTGRAREDVVGRTVFDLAPPEVAQHHADRDAELFRRPGRQVYEWTLPDADGVPRQVVFNKATFADGSGAVAGVICAILDVTELKEAQARLEQLNRELEDRVAVRTDELRAAMDHLVQAEKLAALGHLVAGVAHELGTPLGNVLTVSSAFAERLADLSERLFSGRLKRSDAEATFAQLVEVSRTLERNAQRAGELIANFKQVAVDQASVRRRAFDLAQTVAEILQTLHPLTRARSEIAIDVAVPAGIVLDSYPGPFEQVITNLVVNSLTHAFDDLPAGRIEIAAEMDGEQVRVVFSDDGHGIAPDILGRIFDPFFTTRLGRGGSGLGLYLVHTIVSGQLGGRLRVESTPGHGTRFEMLLPRKAPEAAAPAVPAQPPDFEI